MKFHNDVIINHEEIFGLLKATLIVLVCFAAFFLQKNTYVYFFHKKIPYSLIINQSILYYPNNNNLFYHCKKWKTFFYIFFSFKLYKLMDFIVIIIVDIKSITFNGVFFIRSDPDFFLLESRILFISSQFCNFALLHNLGLLSWPFGANPYLWVSALMLVTPGTLNMAIWSYTVCPGSSDLFYKVTYNIK